MFVENKLYIYIYIKISLSRLMLGSKVWSVETKDVNILHL